MNDIHLTENFKMSELTASETARRRKINNHLDFWIHVSCRRDSKLNRHKVVYYMKKTPNTNPAALAPCKDSWVHYVLLL